MEIQTEIERLATQCGVILLEWAVSNEGEPPYVKLVIDTEKGVTISEITSLHKKLRKSEVFSENFSNGFQGEVTSPGIDFPLTYSFQFTKNLNKRMRLVPNIEEENSTIEGVLNEFDGEILKLQTDSGEINFPFDELKEGRLVF